MSNWEQDPDSNADPQVSAALRDVVGEPPYGAVDWWAMRVSIVGDAAPMLAARRQRGSWASYIVRWSSMTVPVGIAAGIAAVATLAFTPVPARSATVADEAVLTAEGLLGVVSGSASRTVLADSVMGSIGMVSSNTTVEDGL